ncbi:LysR family transcriptional regulator [Oceanisphaera arctica]|uniref:LysR family transcriptional regulator n=1 Tax=Oceanisphaera arctica TaxID=641510 RepID=A0A2P5TMD6_9GAMM|nr:LysR family transcriptional regulator [Oceanisphaera arctica]PPL16598.1 LysR family transcriptional regulator [Oceanisphaera arctica]GHA10836.1 transcriptional regulator [Oceanisphaera arctica]
MWKLNPRALKYLNEVARFGSLRKVAAHLNVDVSAISRQLAQLEEELGTAVGMRSGQGFVLTQVGEELVALFRQQKASEAAALSRIEALQSLKRGRVSIAVGEGFIADLISAPLQAFMARYPGIQISVEMAGANEATRLVKEDRVDLALVYAPSPDAELYSHVVTRQPLELITPPGHPLTRLAPLSIRQISGYPLALIDQQFGMGQLVSLVEELEHIRFEPQLRTNSVAVLKNFVLSGMGVTFMPGLTVHSEIKQGRIACVPVPHPVLAGASAHIVSHKGRELTVSAEALINHLHDGMLFFN